MSLIGWSEKFNIPYKILKGRIHNNKVSKNKQPESDLIKKIAIEFNK